jgi:hypothetical protein
LSIKIEPDSRGLVPAIHVFGSATKEVVDARVKPGHDADRAWLTRHPSSALYLRKIPSSLNAIRRSLAK